MRESAGWCRGERGRERGVGESVGDVEVRRTRAVREMLRLRLFRSLSSVLSLLQYYSY